MMGDSDEPQQAAYSTHFITFQKIVDVRKRNPNALARGPVDKVLGSDTEESLAALKKMLLANNVSAVPGKEGELWFHLCKLTLGFSNVQAVIRLEDECGGVDLPCMDAFLFCSFLAHGMNPMTLADVMQELQVPMTYKFNKDGYEGKGAAAVAALGQPTSSNAVSTLQIYRGAFQHWSNDASMTAEDLSRRWMTFATLQLDIQEFSGGVDALLTSLRIDPSNGQALQVMEMVLRSNGIQGGGVPMPDPIWVPYHNDKAQSPGQRLDLHNASDVRVATMNAELACIAPMKQMYTQAIMAGQIPPAQGQKLLKELEEVEKNGKTLTFCHRDEAPKKWSMNKLDLAVVVAGIGALHLAAHFLIRPLSVS